MNTGGRTPEEEYMRRMARMDEQLRRLRERRPYVTINSAGAVSSGVLRPSSLVTVLPHHERVATPPKRSPSPCPSEIASSSYPFLGSGRSLSPVPRIVISPSAPLPLQAPQLQLQQRVETHLGQHRWISPCRPFSVACQEQVLEKSGLPPRQDGFVNRMHSSGLLGGVSLGQRCRGVSAVPVVAANTGLSIGGAAHVPAPPQSWETRGMDVRGAVRRYSSEPVPIKKDIAALAATRAAGASIQAVSSDLHHCNSRSTSVSRVVAVTAVPAETRKSVSVTEVGVQVDETELQQQQDDSKNFSPATSCSSFPLTNHYVTSASSSYSPLFLTDGLAEEAQCLKTFKSLLWNDCGHQTNGESHCPVPGSQEFLGSLRVERALLKEVSRRYDEEKDSGSKSACPIHNHRLSMHSAVIRRRSVDRDRRTSGGTSPTIEKRLRRELLEKENLAAELQMMLRERTAACFKMEEKNAALEEKKSWEKQLTSELSEKERMVEDLQCVLHERTEAYSSLEEANAALEDNLLSKNRELELLKKAEAVVRRKAFEEVRAVRVEVADTMLRQETLAAELAEAEIRQRADDSRDIATHHRAGAIAAAEYATAEFKMAPTPSVPPPPGQCFVFDEVIEQTQSAQYGGACVAAVNASPDTAVDTADVGAVWSYRLQPQKRSLQPSAAASASSSSPRNSLVGQRMPSIPEDGLEDGEDISTEESTVPQELAAEVVSLDDGPDEETLIVETITLQELVEVADANETDEKQCL